MDTALADAFVSPQTGSSISHGGMVSDSSMSRSGSKPFVKVDGTLTSTPGPPCACIGWVNRKLTTWILTDPPKFDLESYIANYTGKQLRD